MTTMQDVARRANVAVSTVSYALSGARPVAPATAERIRQAMEELDYYPNAMARGLARRRSYTLAMTFPEFDAAMGETVFEIVRGARGAAADLGYHLVVWPVAPSSGELVDLVRQGKADGVLLVEVSVDDSRVAQLARAGLPFVMVGRTRDPGEHAYVDIDFDRAVTDAVTELYVRGHRRIVFVGRPESQLADGYGPAVRARAAYVRAAKRLDLPTGVISCDANPVAGRRLAHHLAGLAERPTGVVVLNDMAALGLSAGLQEAGLRVPDDVSLVGAVSSRTLGAMTHPALCTSYAPGERMGARAAHALVQILDHQITPAQCQHLVTCARVRGDSIGPAPPTDIAG